MSAWTDLGLPYPEAAEYGYSAASGLLRTPFATAAPRQRRRHLRSTRTFTAHVLLTQAQLAIATNFLDMSGHSWFSMDLLSGAFDGEYVTPLLVRLWDNYGVSTAGADYYRLQLPLEQLAERSIIVTTRLYGVGVSDSLYAGLQIPPRLEFWRPPVEEFSLELVIPSGSLVHSHIYSEADQSSVQATLVIPSYGSLSIIGVTTSVFEPLTATLVIPTGSLIDTTLFTQVVEDLTTTLVTPLSGDLS